MMFKKINKNSLCPPEEFHSYNFLMDEINKDSCKEVINWILECNMALGDDKPKFLNLFINSPGGCLDSAFSLIDFIKASEIPVRTIGTGIVGSAALMIFMSGLKGSRVMTPNTSILTHTYHTGVSGKHHELMGNIKGCQIINERMRKHYIDCGVSASDLDKLLSPTDLWLTPPEAKKYRLTDIVSDLK